jgi:hypothetical protein
MRSVFDVVFRPAFRVGELCPGFRRQGAAQGLMPCAAAAENQKENAAEKEAYGAENQKEEKHGSLLFDPAVFRLS